MPERAPEAGNVKIVSRTELLARREVLRAEGKRLVQCHGCFDIVHPGHVRHLRQAKALGDVLLVTLTGDEQIRKGTGRPLIPEELRAENLAALDFVDLVYVEPGPTAREILAAVRPDVYVKGKEYEVNDDPRFAEERRVVEAGGGRVVFSSGDVVFSSTALIAALEQALDPFQARLAQLTADPRLAPGALAETIAQFRGRRVLVIGETILDTYVLCDRPEVAGESPVMTLRPVQRRHYDGGAAIIARHAAALGARPVLLTPLPDDESGEELRQRLVADGIDVRAFPVRRALPEKQRFLVGTQKVMKLDLLEPLLLDAREQSEFLAVCEGTARELAGGGQADAVILADFGLGLFTTKLLVATCRAVRPFTRVLAGDVSGKRSSLTAMVGMDLLCPSESELRDAMGLQSEGLPLVALRLMEATASRSVIVTLGADGLIAFDRRAEGVLANGDGYAHLLKSEHVPALCATPIDPLGCGDALLTSATLGLAAGADLLAAAFLGACAAATEVQRLGNLPIHATDVRQLAARIHAAHLTYAGAEVVESRTVALRAG